MTLEQTIAILDRRTVTLYVASMTHEGACVAELVAHDEATDEWFCLNHVTMPIDRESRIQVAKTK